MLLRRGYGPFSPCYSNVGHLADALVGKDRLAELFQAFQADLGAFDVSHFVRKAADQRDIVTSREDLRVLKKAMSAFTSLQHLQILRLQDEPDRVLVDYIRENYEAATEYVELKWTPACVHGIRTLGQALLEGSSPFTRFSGPMMNPQSLLELQTDSSKMVSTLASRLTCLELHFDENFQLDQRMRQLSDFFKDVFSVARGMQAVHIGFPSRTPLRLGLEEIFHHVRWERLRAFGIQAWRLDAEEIIGFVRRHRRTLRGLRLRDVLLKEPSMWKTILVMLRKEMECLDWVSLRRIGYTRSFDEHVAGTMEVFPEPPGEVSDSDSDDDDDDDEQEFTTHLNDNVNGVTATHYEEEDDEHDYDSDEDDEDDNHGPEANEISMEPDPDTPSSVPWCNCLRSKPSNNSNNRSTTINWETLNESIADNLGDNGIEVFNWQRKLWEKWVVGKCPEHGNR